ncbi:hypothetical protein COY60_03830 [Candidatus Gracilibacteria bacterium CG_4_10_14_0_8_um_filter_38_28]|nr:MAG: hypothetical protein COY60_03830 [Candidatus Gracilibacteria bacterium CG_4_10_14_0_8_um_filter_38_28]
MEKTNLTSQEHPRAPAVIQFGSEFISASDYGFRETRKLLEMRRLSEDSIDKIMAARVIAKMGHGYKKEVVRRTGERYFDHPSGVALLLLLELGIIDPDILAAAQLHDVLEDVKINLGELGNLIKRSTSPEALRIVQMVTNPEKTGDAAKDKQIKERHYHLISQDFKASVLKIADRMYNLRSLEVFWIEDSLLTEKHISKAEEQIEETKKFILPIAEKHGLSAQLFAEIMKVENRVFEARLSFAQRNTQDTTNTILKT